MKICLFVLAAGLVLASVGVVAREKSAAPGFDEAWGKVEFEERGHAPLLERHAKLAPRLAGDPVVLTLVVLDPDISGLVTAVSAAYDRMENASEVEVTVSERGIMDDDLLGIRHVVSLARNRNDEWRVTGYRRGELRRVHMK